MQIYEDWLARYKHREISVKIRDMQNTKNFRSPMVINGKRDHLKITNLSVDFVHTSQW